MAFTLTSSISCWSKSRVSDASVHPRQYELIHYNDPGDHRNNWDHNLWVCIKQMVRRQHHSYLHVFRRNSGFRFGIQYDHRRQRLYTRNSNKSSQSGTRSNRDRKRNRHYLYYGIIISILTIGGIPAHAEEGETNNTSNPVAAATGNVTNQAVQFQNNGAPSRQVIGPNISCNGATMTFSPFYMGNHTTPWWRNEPTELHRSWELGWPN